MLMHHYVIELTSRRFLIMDATELLAICSGILHMECSSCSPNSFGQMISTLRCSAAPLKGFYTAFVCSEFCPAHAVYCRRQNIFGLFMTTINDAFEWELTLEDIGYKSGSKSLSVPTPICQKPSTISCFDTGKFIFQSCHS